MFINIYVTMAKPFWQPFFLFAICFFSCKKGFISIFTYWIIVLFTNILSNIIMTMKSNTRFTLYLGIFHFEGTNNVAICILLKNLTIWRYNDIKLRQYVHQRLWDVGKIEYINLCYFYVQPSERRSREWSICLAWMKLRFLFAFRAKNREWRDSSSGFLVTFQGVLDFIDSTPTKKI